MIYPVSRFGFYTDIKVLPVVIRQCQPEDACPEQFTEREMLNDPCKVLTRSAIPATPCAPQSTARRGLLLRKFRRALCDAEPV